MPIAKPVNGVFAGGGIKGVALAGAVAAALDEGYRFERIVGTSSGALVGALVAAGYGADDLRKTVAAVPWPGLADRCLVARIPGVGRHLSLLTRKGINRGDRLERTWRRLLAAHGVRTFADLPPGALRVIATDVTHQRGVVLPDHLSRYGIDPAAFPVARAVRISSTVPFFYRPVTITARGTGHRSLLVDGAITADFPLPIADWEADRPVLGFRFSSPEDDRRHIDVRGPASLARAVIGAAVHAGSSLDSPLLQRALLIDIDEMRDPLDFDLSPAAAVAMFDRAREAAAARFTTVVPARGPLWRPEPAPFPVGDGDVSLPRLSPYPSVRIA